MRFALSLAILILSVAGCIQSAGAAETTGGIDVPVDFKTFARRDSPNDYLVCPPDHCANAKPDRAAPVFDVPAVELRRRVGDVLANRPRSRVIFADQRHVVAEERSAIFRFPDLIDVETIAIGPSQSTVAIYSRSKYGYYDFGANERRVEGWLRELAASPR